MGALVFLGGAEASASPSFALPMFITIKKIIILHLFLGVPAATVGGTGTPWHTRGYAPAPGCDMFVRGRHISLLAYIARVCFIQTQIIDYHKSSCVDNKILKTRYFLLNITMYFHLVLSSGLCSHNHKYEQNFLKKYRRINIFYTRCCWQAWLLVILF